MTGLVREESTHVYTHEDEVSDGQPVPGVYYRLPEEENYYVFLPNDTNLPTVVAEGSKSWYAQENNYTNQDALEYLAGFLN